MRGDIFIYSLRHTPFDRLLAGVGGRKIARVPTPRRRVNERGLPVRFSRSRRDRLRSGRKSVFAHRSSRRVPCRRRRRRRFVRSRFGPFFLDGSLASVAAVKCVVFVRVFSALVPAGRLFFCFSVLVFFFFLRVYKSKSTDFRFENINPRPSPRRVRRVKVQVQVQVLVLVHRAFVPDFCRRAFARVVCPGFPGNVRDAKP